MNDGKRDPYGLPVAGTMQRTGPQQPGSLYRLESDGSVRPILDGLAIPNGLAWPEPDRLWHIDTPTRRIGFYEYPEHGPVGRRIRSLDVSHLPGMPDGMTLDEAGNLWVAFWDGGAVHCLSPGAAARHRGGPGAADDQLCLRRAGAGHAVRHHRPERGTPALRAAVRAGRPGGARPGLRARGRERGSVGRPVPGRPPGAERVAQDCPSRRAKSIPRLPRTGSAPRSVMPPTGMT